MRIRHIAGSDEEVAACPVSVSEEAAINKNWTDIFGNDRPVRLEIGVGKGQFIIEMARKYPEANFVGIDLFTDVLVRAVRKWTRDENAPDNLRLVLWDAAMIEQLFEPGSVECIYLNFPDPWPKPRHEKRRLTSPSFLRSFATVLKPGGQLEFKTDNQDLFTYSLEQFEIDPQFVVDEVTRDLHVHARLSKDNVRTEYEEKFSEQGMPICKLIALRRR